MPKNFRLPKQTLKISESSPIMSAGKKLIPRALGDKVFGGIFGNYRIGMKLVTHSSSGDDLSCFGVSTTLIEPMLN
jgi:hypothetical protein